MASIAFDNSADLGNNNQATNTLTTAYTTSGTNRVLYVGVMGDVNGGFDDIASVTYAGILMTLVGKVLASAVVNRCTYLYVLENPVVGSNNVIVTSTNVHYLLAGAYSLNSGAQTGQPEASSATATAADASTYTTSLTSLSNNAWEILFEGGYNGGGGPNAGAGAIRRSFDLTFGTWGFFDSNGPITPPQLYSMTTTRTNVQNAIVHITASTAPFSGLRLLPLTGVGR